MKILLAALNSKFVHTNIAIRYIKSYCSQFDITIREYTINDLLYNITSDILSVVPDVVGFSCYIWNIDEILKVCSNLKKIKKDIIIALGGPEVSFDSANLMDKHDFIDYIVKGEGELPTKELFSFLEGKAIPISGINGIVYRQNGRIIENKEMELINNLDSIPFPYEGEENLNKKILYYESSRGCPYNCSYCLSSTIKGVRFFSLERIKKDLLWFIDRDVRLVKFVDRTFNCSKFALDILKFLAGHKKNTKFHFEISGDIIDDNMIEFLRTVPEGLFQFEIGIQSTNKKTLSLIDRKTNLEKLFDNIKRLREPDNIDIHVDLIAGLPEENYESFIESFNESFKLRPHMLQMGFLKMLKGSKIREESAKYGMAYTEYAPYEILKNDVMPFSEISHLKNIEEVTDRYYNSGRFKATLMYMASIYDNPFYMFEDIKNFENLTFKGKSKISNTGQYELLYSFCKNSRSCDISIVKECLAFDYLMQGRNPSLPNFLMSDSKVDKKFIWDFFSDRENIRRFLPYYSGKDVRNIIKNIHVRRFSIDICSYIKSGSIIRGDIYVAFDYGYKISPGKTVCFTMPLP